MVFTKTFALGVAATLAATGIEAHNNLVDPAAYWLPGVGGNANNPAGTINGPAVMQPLPGGHFDWGQEVNTESFTAAFKAQTKYTSLRDLIEKEFKEADTVSYPAKANTVCGLSQLGGPVQPLPDKIKWDAFTHWGPAEVWCDDTMVWQADNAAVTHSNGAITYDKTQCQGKTQLRTYWLGLHVPLWQVYIGCAAIGTGTPVTTPAVTPPPTSTTVIPTTTPVTTPPTSSGGLKCNYEGQLYAICRNANAWSFENGSVCVGITRCVSQSPPYGVVRS